MHFSSFLSAIAIAALAGRAVATTTYVQTYNDDNCTEENELIAVWNESTTCEERGVWYHSAKIINSTNQPRNDTVNFFADNNCDGETYYSVPISFWDQCTTFKAFEKGAAAAIGYTATP